MASHLVAQILSLETTDGVLSRYIDDCARSGVVRSLSVDRKTVLEKTCFHLSTDCPHYPKLYSDSGSRLDLKWPMLIGNTLYNSMSDLWRVNSELDLRTNIGLKNAIRLDLIYYYNNSINLF